MFGINPTSNPNNFIPPGESSTPYVKIRQSIPSPSFSYVFILSVLWLARYFIAKVKNHNLYIRP